MSPAGLYQANEVLEALEYMRRALSAQLRHSRAPGGWEPPGGCSFCSFLRVFVDAAHFCGPGEGLGADEAASSEPDQSLL